MTSKAMHLIPLLFLFLLAAPQTGLGEEPAPEMVRFKWAFIHQPAGSTEEKVIDIKNPPGVRSGDRLRIYLQPLDRTCLYLFLVDSQKGLYLLFPEQPDYYTTGAVHGDPAHFLPDRMSWFELDDSRGVEKFYLLASPEPLQDLEGRVREYLARPEDMETKAGVLEEIKRIRREHSSLTSVAEKGVPIAGTIRHRGGPISVVSLASLVEAEGFYSKTVRLRHE